MGAALNPTHERMLRYFEYAQLPPGLQEVSRPFGELAVRITSNLGADPAETTVALRKLLEAKDAAVRAALPV